MKVKILLLAILVIAAILRLYKLGDLPRGLYIDEVSIGYNAWSVLHTGKDEYQVSFPLVFQAFGEYKLPAYIYGSMPFIALFGLNAFSVRLLSALAGIFATLGIYLLTKELVTRSEHTKQLTGLIAAVLFAVSPWSIQFSRAAFESNLALTLVIFALYFFLHSLNTTALKVKPFIASLILFAVSLYTYNATRIILPLLIPILVMLYASQLFRLQNRKIILISLGSILFIVLFSLFNSILGQESARARQVMELENKQYHLGAFLGVTEKYFTHFSPDFLFFNGDIQARHSVRELGEIYFPQFIFILIGIYTSIRQKSKSSIVLLAWLLLAPLPAALTTPVPHALRSLLMLPPLIIYSALGITATYTYGNRLNQKYASAFMKLFPPAIALLLLFSVGTYLHVYYKHYIYKTSWDWDEHNTLLGEALATEYIENPKILIEAQPIVMIYIRFFNATHNQLTQTSRYIFYSDTAPVTPQSGDIVVLNGWKGTPEQLTQVKELKMLNSSIGYKIGEWHQ